MREGSPQRSITEIRARLILTVGWSSAGAWGMRGTTAESVQMERARQGLGTAAVPLRLRGGGAVELFEIKVHSRAARADACGSDARGAVLTRGGPAGLPAHHAAQGRAAGRHQEAQEGAPGARQVQGALQQIPLHLRRLRLCQGPPRPTPRAPALSPPRFLDRSTPILSDIQPTFSLPLSLSPSLPLRRSVELQRSGASRRRGGRAGGQASALSPAAPRRPRDRGRASAGG